MVAYYAVFVLSLALCEAPAGKTACEKWTMTFEFADALDCWVARESFIDYYDARPTIIVDREETTCAVQVKSASSTDREILTKFATRELQNARIAVIGSRKQ